VPNTFPRLTSRQHPLVETCRQLARARKGRAEVLLDGAHLVQDAVRAGAALEAVLVSTAFLEKASRLDRALLTRAAREGTRVVEVSAAVLEAASPAETPSGILAIGVWTPASPAALMTAAPALVVGLVDVQDPGNVGSVIRSADALGATGVVAAGETADPGGWKALRGAMGSTFRLPVACLSVADTLAVARQYGLTIVGTVAGRDGTPLDRVDLTRPTLVLLGREGAGLAPAVLAKADAALTIPMRDAVDSMNVAVTSALILYEARRQRAGRT
jgi:TrmH family RNA methyltransferase